jgi:gamma-glutamylcyclotransferase
VTGLLFAYGSNLAAAEMAAWCPEARFAGLARLPDHRLALNRRSIRWGGGVVDVVAADVEQVWGVLYDVDDAAVAALDRKEGAGIAYRLTPVGVEHRGEPRGAHTYTVITKEPDAPPATPEYAELVLRGARERGLPEEWLAVLDSVLRGSVPAR